MSENKLLYINILFHLIFTFILTNIQTGLWYDIFGGFPTPFFWLLCLVYYGIYRSNKDAVLLFAFNVFIVMNYTVAPLGLIFLSSFGVFVLMTKLKSRVFWRGPSYFVMMSAISVPVFYILYYGISWSFEEIGFAKIRWFYILTQILLTTLISPLFYFIFQNIDRISGKEQSLPMEEML
jgi:hypothetical protein